MYREEKLVFSRNITVDCSISVFQHPHLNFNKWTKALVDFRFGLKASLLCIKIFTNKIYPWVREGLFNRTGLTDHSSLQAGICFSRQPTCWKITSYNHQMKAPVPLIPSFFCSSFPLLLYIFFPQYKFGSSSVLTALHPMFPVSRRVLNMLILQSSRVAGKYQTKWCLWDHLHDRKWRFKSSLYAAAYSCSYFSACLPAV